MNGKRCAIRIARDEFNCEDLFVSTFGGCVVLGEFSGGLAKYLRIFGSHSEAKRELEKWLPAWPDAKIVDEGDL